jgi:hypothetical protein
MREPILVKRYAGSRLYDTSKARSVTVEELREWRNQRVGRSPFPTAYTPEDIRPNTARRWRWYIAREGGMVALRFNGCGPDHVECEAGEPGKP